MPRTPSQERQRRLRRSQDPVHRQNDRDRHQAARRNETEAARARRREQDRVRHADRYENEHQDDRQRRREQRAQVAARRQELWWLHFPQESSDQRIARAVRHWDRTCERCGALLLQGEPVTICCNDGANFVEALPPLPATLLNLLSAPDISKHSRRLNNLFSFTAIGTTEKFIRQQAPSNVVLTGRTYHRMLNVIDPTHSIHWFLYDEQERVDRGVEWNVPPEWIDVVTNLLTEVNPYVQQLQQFNNNNVPDEAVLELPEFTTNGDFAAIMHANDSTVVNPRSILIWRLGEQEPSFISLFSRHYEPLQYPLFFPHATPGWGLIEHDHRPPTNAFGLTQIKYYRFRLCTEDRFLRLGRLTNEYICDMYSRTQEQTLEYIRKSRLHIAAGRRAEDADENEPVDIELPASFIGSRKWASEQTADSLALARAYGKGSLFITMTTNPNWPEIQDRLYPNQSAADQPTTVARVFKKRLQHCNALLRSKFGKLLYLVQVIEFQKRGLPHAHTVLKIHPELPPDQLDCIIKASLPTNNPRLRAKVQKHMTHRRNHLSSQYSRCNKDGHCIYGFPHPITPTTWIDEDGRVHWRRLSDDDLWISPHIPFLIDELDCHIHSDVVSTATVFVYLYKYLFKGSDHTLFNILAADRPPIDEAKDFVKARYLSATEGAWRIFENGISLHEPSVTRLAVHLEGENFGQFYRRNEAQSSSSTLLRYFARPRDAPFVDLLYSEYYEQYILAPWDGAEPPQGEYLEEDRPYMPRKIVRARAQREKIARLQSLSPTLGDVFYLRCLLLHRPGWSHQDMYTINGHRYDSYAEVAKQLGLFDDQNEGHWAMQEAVDSLRTPGQLRFLFARIIAEGYPALPLWDAFKDKLSEDFVRLLRSEEAGIDRTLEAIAQHLQDHGRGLAAYGMPEPQHRSQEVLSEIEAFSGRREALLNRAAHDYASLTDEQRHIYDELITPLERKSHDFRPRFIEGKPGRGKTFLLNTLCAQLRGLGHIVLIVAATGIAASNYERGRTAHNLFRITINDENVNITSEVPVRSMRADLIAAATVIIFDELPGANKTTAEAIDVKCREIMNEPLLPFGGIPFIALGDFRQIAPVVKNAGSTATFNASILSSHLWPLFKVHTIQQPYRNRNDPDFSTWVDRIGEDTTGNRVTIDLIRHTEELADVIDFLYPPYVLEDPSECIKRSFLSPRNDHVDEFNAHILDLLPGDEMTYYSADSVKEGADLPDDDPQRTPDYLSMLKMNGIPPHALRLKEGCICVLMRNFSVKNRLVKNARVVVERLHNRFVEIRTVDINGNLSNDTHCIPRIRFNFRPSRASWTVDRLQFPLRLAYATTFNSCQGLTLNKTALDCRTDVFAHGQLYTASSRVRTRDDSLALFAEGSDHTTANIQWDRLMLHNA